MNRNSFTTFEVLVFVAAIAVIMFSMCMMHVYFSH